MGFVYRENMFQWTETMAQPLHLSIFVQKNLDSDTFKIGLRILIRSPLLNNQGWRPLLLAHLLPEGIRFRAPTEIWWPPQKLGEAVNALKRDALPWFRKWCSPNLLLEKVEISIEQRKSLIEIVEPLSCAQEDALQRIWPRGTEVKPTIPVIAYFSASVLHYLVGNKERSIRRTEDWLHRLSATEAQERAEALEQLSALKRESFG